MGQGLLGILDRLGIEVEEGDVAQLAELLVLKEALNFMGRAATQVEHPSPLSGEGIALRLRP